MSTTITITVPGLPIAQPRGRAVSQGGKFARVISAPGAHPVWQWRDRIKHEVDKMLALVGGENLFPLVQPALYALFVFPFTGTPRKTKPNPRTIHTSRPDLDNLLKSLKDALGETTIIKDDKAIWKYDFVCKIRGEPDEQPHTLIQLREAEMGLDEERGQNDDIPF